MGLSSRAGWMPLPEDAQVSGKTGGQNSASGSLSAPVPSPVRPVLSCDRKTSKEGQGGQGKSKETRVHKAHLPATPIRQLPRWVGEGEWAAPSRAEQVCLGGHTQQPPGQCLWGPCPLPVPLLDPILPLMPLGLGDSHVQIRLWDA